MKTIRSADGTTIAFEQAGEGPAVILVDGALCYRAFGPMGPLSALLSPHFTVFTYDRRGRGDSTDTVPYAVEREVEDIEALIRAAGGSAFVYGVSSGAALALEAAACGLNIKKLAMYEPPFVAVDDSRPPVPDDYVMQLEAAVSSGRRGDAVELFMTKAVGLPAEAVAPLRNSPIWPALESVAHTLPYDATVLGDYAVPVSRAASIRIPTLVMDGGASPAGMRNAARSAADAIPGAKYRTLEGQTHELATEVLVPVLVEFFG